jgi:hypothetical protein
MVQSDNDWPLKSGAYRPQNGGTMRLSVRLLRTLMVAALLFALAVPAARADSTRSPVVVPAGQPIPKGFKTWSLFLVCNPAWLGDDPASKARMVQLHSAFLGFGGSLGTQNAAVWLTTAGGNPSDYDADRAGDFCGTYGLSSNLSPYVVVSSDYPTVAGAPGDFAAISLAGLSTDNMLALLGQLSDRIRASQLDRDRMDSDRYWRGWVQVLEDSEAVVRKIAKGFSFSVDARVVKVRFDGKALSQ